MTQAALLPHYAKKHLSKHKNMKSERFYILVFPAFMKTLVFINRVNKQKNLETYIKTSSFQKRSLASKPMLLHTTVQSGSKLLTNRL